jgi:tetratricopeptide (TPR) repeat protein
MRKFHPFLTSTLVCLAIVPLAGCSTIDLATRITQAMAEVTEADRNYNLGNVAGGREWLQKAVDLVPDQIEIYNGGDNGEPGVISVASTRGDYPFLASLLTKEATQPKLVNPWQLYMAIGDAYDHLGDVADKHTAYAEALASLKAEFPSPTASTPDGEPVRFMEAQCELEAGDIAAAKVDFDTVIRLDSDVAADAQNDEAYFMAEDGTDLDQALTLATTALNTAEKAGNLNTVAMYQDTVAWVLYNQYLKTKDPATLQKAITYEELSVDEVPEEGDDHLHLAMEYEAAGRDSDAAVEYSRVANLEPANTSARAEAQRLAAVPDKSQPPV